MRSTDKMSATYITPDAKKEEFRKYLDKAGVVDALTKGARPPIARSCANVRRPGARLRSTPRSLPSPAVLVGLYEEPERPPNAVEYVKKVMGAPVGVDVDALKAENERLKAENKALKELIEARAKEGTA